MKFKQIILIVCIMACICLSASAVFANDTVNETLSQGDLALDELQVSSNELNSTDDKLGDVISSNVIYFDASASADGVGTLENPYKVYKSDRIKFGTTAYFADGVYDITDSTSIYSSSKYQIKFIGASADKTILRSALTNKFDFTVTDNSYFVLKDLTLVGVHINNQANLIADNVIFTDSTRFNPNYPPTLSYYHNSKVYDSTFGGVIICDTPTNKVTTLNLTNCNFNNNDVLSGGVIAAYNTNAYLQNCEFYNSSADNFGGAIYSIKSTFNIYDTTFELNNAKYGGAIYTNASTFNLKDSQFKQSQAISFGGAIASFFSQIGINNVDFNDYASLNDAGGAIYSTGGSVTVDGSSFKDGHSDFGGAICNLKADLTIKNSDFINNYATHYGGSIYNMYGSVALTGNNFNNTRASSGGSVFNRLSDSFNLKNNKFTLSTADEGELVFIDGNKVDVVESGNTYDSSYVLLKYGNLYDIDYFKDVPIIAVSPEPFDAVPISYDARKYGYITSVKDQGQGGNCWAFSGIATLEACLKKATGIDYDFSEENVKNLMYEYSLFDLDTGVASGGNLYMFIAYLASWFGPTYDVNDVYDEYSSLSALYDAIVHVQNVYILPERTSFYDNEHIKKAVLNYGAVSIGIDLPSGVGHAVTIVGWDDEYTSTDFLGNKAVGAWIIKNSWGSSWGYNGYGYLSYQQSISFGYTFIFDDDRGYSNVYQYDFEGKSGYHTTNSNQVFIKNQFTAENDEILSAVSTYFDEPANYTVSIYLNGKQVTTQDGISEEMGYYTIPLNDEIELKKGDTFEVVVKFNGKYGFFPVCTADEINKMNFGEGISFYSADGKTWGDLYKDIHGVACIKAFTHSKTLSDVSLALDQSGGTESNPFGNINLGDVINIQLALPQEFIADGNKQTLDGLVKFTIDGKNYFATVENGKACLNISFEQEGVHNVSAQFISSRAASKSINFTVNVVKTAQTDLHIIANDVSKFYGGSETYSVTLNKDGKVLSGVNVRILVDDKEYSVEKTDANGQIIIDFDLPVGTYYVSAIYGGKTTTSKFTVLSTINVEDISQEYGDSEISASFLKTDGNALTNAQVSFNIELYGVYSTFNEKVDATTNVAGIAISQIILPASKYTVSVVNPVSGEKKQFILDILPIDTKCSVSVTQTASTITFSAIIDSDAVITKYVRFDQNNPYVNFLVSGNVFKADAGLINVQGENKTFLSSSVTIGRLSVGDYEVSAIFSGDGNFKVSSDSETFSVSDPNPNKLTSTIYVCSYGNAGTIVQVTDGSGNNVQGELVYATVANQTVSAITDDNGQARFEFADLEVGDYQVFFEYKGQTLMNYLFVHSTIDMSALSGQYLNSKVGATFRNFNTNLLANEDVKFIINGKEYSAVTDANGYAAVDVDLPVGTHSVTAVNLYTNERKHSKITIYKTTPSIKISKYKRGDSVFITATLEHTSAIGNVVFTMDSNKYVSTIKNGEAILALIVLDEGSHEVYANYIGDPNFNNILSTTLKFDYEKTNYTLSAQPVSKYYSGSDKFKVTLNNFNRPVSGEIINVVIGDKVYNLTTDSNGVATFNGILESGSHTVICTFEDKIISSEIVVRPTITVTSSTVGQSVSKLTAEFRDATGNLLKNKEVTFKVGSKEFKKTTDANGVATLDSGLDKGSYNVTIINPVTGETKVSGLTIIKSTPALSLSTVKQDGVNVLKAVLPKDATGYVEFVLDNVDQYEYELEGGQCILDGIGPGEYDVVATYHGNDAYNEVSQSHKFIVYRVAAVLTATGVTTTYGTSKKIVMTLKDTRGDVLVGRTILITLNNKVYHTIVSSDGDAVFSVPASLAPKTYTAKVTFAGEDVIGSATKTVKVVVKKATVKLTAAKKTFKVKDKTKKYVVTLKTNKNKVYKKQKITIKVKGKTYKATTNTKGQATFKLNKLTKKGSFSATVTFAGNTYYNKLIKKVKITVK
ncbi:MAG: hypothetical protein E7Z81_06145 [Methanobrevibacter sp.]|uniref:lectin like domain-containing protein n=1 Tax=Methanobrevibacter sp. TaxID=66852 RepID=UPI0025F1A159|nr:Ig-like domain repeat protein [Methanobrevibacter sp.]MBE6497842.1 hypothetical protein [Methanobrevibacter sp.]